MPDGRDSAPDLRILGDQITLQPSGYVEPSKAARREGREEALMHHMARFRSEPLQCVPYSGIPMPFQLGSFLPRVFILFVSVCSGTMISPVAAAPSAIAFRPKY